MIVLLCFAGLYRYIGSGPFWPETIWGAEHCKTNWWTNLLYVNNLVQVKAQVRFYNSDSVLYKDCKTIAYKFILNCMYSVHIVYMF